MRRIFERMGRWSDAIEFMNAEVYLSDEKKQPVLYLRMGELWEEKLHMPHQALSCYLRVMGHGFHRPTAERIMRIQRQVEDYQGLMEILQRDIRVTDKPEELIPKLLELGKIQWRKLEDPVSASESYQKIVKVDPSHLEALEALEELLGTRHEWDKLITVLRRKREILQEPETVRILHGKIGEVYDRRFHRGNLAIKEYEKALELAPKDVDILHILQRLYDEWGQFRKAITLYNRELSLIEDRQRRGESPSSEDDRARLLVLQARISQTWEERLFNDENAIAAYERLNELDPQTITAASALARLYRRYQAWDKLIAVNQKLIADARARQDGAEEVRIQLDLAEVYEHRQQKPQEAIAVYQRILEIEPAHLYALQSLERLFRNFQRIAEMAALVQGKLGLCTRDEERLSLYIHLGRLHEKELNQPQEAVAAFEAAAQLSPNHLEVLESLDRLYGLQQKWESLGQVLRREIELIENPKRKAEFCYRLGILQRDRFANPSQARETLNQSIAFDPSHRKSLKALTGLAIMAEEWTAAVKLMETEIVLIADPEEKVLALTDMGSLYQSKLKLTRKAREAFQAALDIDPKASQALEAVADIHFDMSEWKEAEPIFGRLILLLEQGESERLAEIYYRMGYIAEKLGKTDEAIMRYSSSLQARPNHFKSLESLGHLYYERAGWGFDKAQWQDALSIYDQLNVHPALEEKEEVIRCLAVIHEHLGNFDQAVGYYQKVMADNPDNLECFQAMARLYIGQGNDEMGVQYLSRIARGEYAFKDKRESLLTMADALTRLKRHREAIDANLKAFAMGVEDPTILKKLADAYLSMGDWEQAADWTEKHFTCLEETLQRAENRCLKARILEAQQKNAQAIAAYQEGLSIDPACVPAVEGIAAICEKNNDWASLVKYDESFLRNLPADKKEASIPIHLALGRLYTEKQRDLAKAIDSYTQVLAIDARHAAAQMALAHLKAMEPGYHAEAIEQNRAVLKSNPLHIAAYRDLCTIWRQRQELDRAIRACRGLALCKVQTPEEADFLAGAPTRKIKTVDHDALLMNLIPNQGGFRRELMAITSPEMEKVYPPDIEPKYGIRKKDRLGAEGGQPAIWHLVTEVMRILQIPELHLYLNPARTHRVYLENTKPPTLLLSQSLIDQFSTEEMRFLLAKYLFYVAQNQILTVKLERKELDRYFNLLREGFLELPGSRPADDESLLKRLQGVFSWKLKRALKERTDIWNGMTQESSEAYLKDLAFASYRCGLMITDSLESAIQMTFRLELLEQSGKLIKADKLNLADMVKVEAVADLLCFNVSEEYSKLRQIAGLA